MMDSPLVSAVIPTHHRPALAVAAVNTALRQSFRELEVIVVIDGPDAATAEAMAQVKDERLRVMELPATRGGSEARNMGVREARGPWVAFLDDDDEWLPHKLVKQMHAAYSSRHAHPIVASAVIARSARGDAIWPRRVPSLPLSEYLFARRSWFQGEALLQTSTLLAPRDLLLTIPFRNGLKRHQDWDWLLRACQTTGAGLEYVPEPLAVWRVQDRRPTVSSSHDWRYSLQWARANRHFLTRRAFGGFLVTQVAPQAAQQRAWRAFLPILAEAVSQGELHTRDVLLYFGMWFVPPAIRQSVRFLLGASAGPTDWLCQR